MTKELGISPTQEKALRGLIKTRGINYAELVKNAFTSNNLPIPKHLPALSILTYREALMIIRYGNDKLKNEESSLIHTFKMLFKYNFY